MMTDHEQPGERRRQRVEDDVPAGEGPRRIAALDGDRVGGDEIADRQHQRRQQPGENQRGDRDLAARGQRIDDHVVAGRHQRADQRGMGGDVDRVVHVVAFPLHHRDHHRAHRRHVRDRRTRDPTEQRAGDDVRHPEPATDVTDQAFRQFDDPMGDAAVKHQFAGEDEERNRQEREHGHAGDHPAEDHRHRQPFVHDRDHRGEPDRERDRDAQHQEREEQDGEDGQCHDGTTSSPLNSAMICSTENSTISTPAIATGTWLSPSGMPSVGIL